MISGADPVGGGDRDDPRGRPEPPMVLPDSSAPPLPSPLRILCDAGVGLDGLPLSFLEEYPHPAFVVVSSVPSPDNPNRFFNDKGQSGPKFPMDLPWSWLRLFKTVESLEPVWGNLKWCQLARAGDKPNGTLAELLSLDSLRRYGHWMAGSYEPTVVDKVQRTYADMNAFRDLGPLYGSAERTPIPPVEDYISAGSIILDFDFPAGPVRLELTKTFQPMSQFLDGVRVPITSHTFAVITCTPRHAEDKLGHVAYPPLTPAAYQEEGEWAASRPIRFHSDGTVTQVRAPRPLRHPTMWNPGGDLSLATSDLLTSTDWSKTPLGPRETWSPSLNVFVQFMATYPLCGGLWWGKDLTLIYNQAYANILPHHPYPFGRSGSEAWAELWQSLGPMTEVLLGGTAFYVEDSLILVKNESDTATRETYQSQMWSPIDLPDGSFGGLFHGMRYCTEKVIGDRRQALLNSISARTSMAGTREEFYIGVTDSFEEAARDAPFAIMYAVSGSGSTANTSNRHSAPASSRSHHSASTARLTRVGRVGIPEGHHSAPEVLTLSLPGEDMASAALTEAFSASEGGGPAPSLRGRLPTATGGFKAFKPGLTVAEAASHVSGSSASSSSTVPLPAAAVTADLEWPLRDAIISQQIVLVQDCSTLIDGYPIRVWGELPTSAVVIPIFLPSDIRTPSLVLVLGLSCRLDFDSSYQSFINALGASLLENYNSVRGCEADALRVEEAEAFERAKNMLFTNMSHQLFTPLNLIAGPLDDVLYGMPSGQQRDALMMARKHVRRLNRLANILMDVSRLEANRMKTSLSCVNLGEITRDIAGLFSKTAESAKLTFMINCDVTPHDVYIDREMWEKMLFTLVGNACDYTREGGVIVSVSYTATEAVFCVEDSGIGIAATDLKHIFSEGTGSALSFTKKLAEIHNGTLEVQSRAAEESADGSHGTRATVRIPLGTAHLSRAVVDRITADSDAGMDTEHMRRWHSVWAGTSSDSLGPPSSNGRTLSSPSGSDQSARQDGRLSVSTGSDYINHGITKQGGSNNRFKGIDSSTLFFAPTDVVMIVDNNSETLRYMRSIFEPFCKVVEARNGQEVLDKFATANPDVVVADVRLPKLNGFELLRALRNGTKEQEMVPFILLQSLQEAQGRHGLNADDYISKPFNARELIARVHMQLQIGKRRKTLEEMFDHRTTELRALSDFSPVGIFRSTNEGYVSYANDAWHELTGFPRDVKPITNWGNYLAEDEQIRVRRTWEEIHRDQLKIITDTAKWKNGKWLATTVVKLDPAVDGSDGIVAYVVDVTERYLNEELQRQRAEEAEARQAEAEDAKRQQELLIDITSHEIRNPISSLMQLTRYCASLVKTNLGVLHEQMKQGLDNGASFMPTDQLLLNIEEDLEALDSIYQCGLTQERISNDVLSLGKIQLDMLQMFDVETDLFVEAQKIITIFQNEARMKGISLSFHFSDAFKDLGIWSVMIDPLRLGQIITNLLANALRFTATSPVRDVELRVDLGTQEPTDSSCAKPSGLAERTLCKYSPIYIFVSVKDTGPGLTREEVEMLFRRFSQASPMTHTVFGGSGLGLYVCRRITEVMGGRIEVLSEAGRGSTFRFFVRARPVIKENVVRPAISIALGKAPNHRSRDKPDKQAAGHPRRRVLIVEDNLINQKVLTRQLKHIGLEVDVASNGLEGLQKIRRTMAVAPEDKELTPPPSATERPYDCVLMDLEMPVMDGYTATRNVRADEKAGVIRPSIVIALTGNARQALIHENMVDFNDVVVKPYRLDNLLRTMEETIRGKARV